MSFENAEKDLIAKGFGSSILVLNDSTATVELAAKAIHVEPGRIAKTLSFYGKDKPFLILTEGTSRIDNHKFKEQFHMKAKMIPSDEVENVIGHAPGGVCPFGIKKGIDVYLDQSLLKYDIVYPAAGDDHSAVKLTIKELQLCSCAKGWVDVCREPVSPSQ